ncbi:hypothetical protein EV182_005234, partial [Spiromyces aspiralis]
MGTFRESMTEEDQDWIRKQKLFVVGTCPLEARGHVNISPKGCDCLRIISANQVMYLDLTGSGVETITHLRQNGRITFMFCAFEGSPRIMRLFGKARVYERQDPEFDKLFKQHFSEWENSSISVGARSIIVADIDKVGQSCGFGVPLYDYQGDRDNLRKSYARFGSTLDRFCQYWCTKNERSIDGIPSGLLGKNGFELHILSSWHRLQGVMPL